MKTKRLFKNTINLTEIDNAELECTVVLDGEFNMLGMMNGIYEPDDKVLSYITSDEQLEALLSHPSISAIICPKSVASRILSDFKGGICTANDPEGVFFKYHNYLGSKTDFYGGVAQSSIHESSFVHPSARIAVKNVRIGINCKIGASVTIKENTNIGDNVTIHDGAVIGAAGFNYFDRGDSLQAAINYGGVSIGDNVEIHTNSTIERGLFRGSTTIGPGSKVGGMTYISHDANIGAGCKIASGAILASYVTIGDGSFIDLGARVGHMVHIGKACYIAVGAALSENLPDSSRYPSSSSPSRTQSYRFEREYWGVTNRK